MSATNKPSPGKSTPQQSRESGSALMAGNLVKPPYNPYAWFEGENLVRITGIDAVIMSYHMLISSI
jgi:hypothetical protein